jgi:hypothetical protein
VHPIRRSRCHHAYSQYILPDLYIYIARSNRVIDNRQDFIPNKNGKGNKRRRRRRRQTNDTLVPCGQFDTNYIIFRNCFKIFKNYFFQIKKNIVKENSE